MTSNAGSPASSLVAALTAALQPLARINGLLCEGGRRLASLLLALMVVIVLLQIIFRYGLNNSLSWTEEIAKTLMVWLTLLVAPWAWRAGAHIRVTLFNEALPGRLRAGIDILLALLGLWITGILLLESLDLFERGLTARAASVPVVTAVFYAILPPGFALLFMVGTEHLMGAVLEFITGVPPHDHATDPLDEGGKGPGSAPCP